MYRVNPPLVRLVAAVPAIITGVSYDWTLHTGRVGQRSEFSIGRARSREVGLELYKDFVFPRLFALLFTTIGMVVLASWAGAVYGHLGAALVALFWCFCPNMLANAPTIVPDVGAMAMGLLACFCGWRYLHRPASETAAWAGVALGFAMLSKLTWVTAVLSLPLAAAICMLALRGSLPHRPIRRRAGDLVLFWAVALLTLNAGYLFDQTLRPLGNFQFCSEMLGGQGCDAAIHGNRFADCWLAGVPVPLPADFLLGIDYLKMEVEQKKWSFLMGEWRFGSWWYYYIMTTLLKTPEPTLLAALIGSLLIMVGRWRGIVGVRDVTMFLFLGIPAVACFVSVSLQGGFNHHHRYVLQIYPVLFALAAYVGSPAGRGLLRFRLPFVASKKTSISISLAFSLAFLSAASTMRVHPYHTSYFNTSSGGPENGWRLLGFSNIDWGQDLLELDKWIREHPECRPLIGSIDQYVDPELMFDQPRAGPPRLPRDASIDEVRTDHVQWWIIGVTRMYNYPGRDGLEYLQQLEPVDRIAYAYHVYRIDPKRTGDEPQVRARVPDR